MATLDELQFPMWGDTVTIKFENKLYWLDSLLRVYYWLQWFVIRCYGNVYTLELDVGSLVSILHAVQQIYFSSNHCLLYNSKNICITSGKQPSTSNQHSGKLEAKIDCRCSPTLVGQLAYMVLYVRSDSMKCSTRKCRCQLWASTH